jgi:hypothetical protein
MLLFANMTASIAHFVALEVFDLIEMLIRIGFLTTGWPWAVIAVFWMEVVIYVAVEALWAVKPGSHTDEDATRKPLRAVVAVGGAVVGRDVIVAIGTLRRNPDFDGYLSLGLGSGYRETDCRNGSERKQFKSVHFRSVHSFSSEQYFADRYDSTFPQRVDCKKNVEASGHLRLREVSRYIFYPQALADR